MTSVGVPVVAGYDRLEPIGRGGVADVFRARCVASGATVAIKVLRDVGDSSAAWRRCRRELAALIALAGHPSIVGLLDVVAAGPHPALVVEYVPGGSLADLVDARRHPIHPGEATRVGRQLAAALAASHARGIVHRDVKPQNVLVAADGTVKLCDFGIASVARSPEFRTATGSVSLRFASPEDLEDDAVVGPPADVYSLGATLLYLVHGQYLDLRDRLVAWQPRSEGAPDPLDVLIADCLAPDPARRPTAATLLERLGELDAQSGRALSEVTAAQSHEGTAHTLPRPRPGTVASVPPAPPRPSPARPRPHRRRALARTVSALLAVAAVAGWWWWRGLAPGEVARPQRVARPGGLVELTSLTWPLGEVGECLVQAPGHARLRSVDCTEPHDLERVGAGRLAEGAFVPARVDAMVDAACAAAARDRAGAVAATIGLAVAVTGPSPGGWEAGERDYQCFVGARDGRLAGSAAAD